MKSKTTALILSVLTGVLGIDRFYLGYTGIGILKLLTGGCFGVLWILDIINIATDKLLPADGSEYEKEASFIISTNATKTSSAFDDLEKITKLHEQGVLDDEEYKKLKADILSKI